MKFWWRVCDVFKWAHGVAFIWFVSFLISTVDTITLEGFLRLLFILIYAGGMTLVFAVIQELVVQEAIRGRKADEQQTLYRAIKDSFLDLDQEV